MGNQFANLPVPAGDGAGAAVDVTTFGALKTIVVGGNSRCTVNIEINNAAVDTDGSWSPVVSFQNTGQITLRVAARWMRVRISGYNPYFGGLAVVDVGGTDDGSQFASLTVPAGNGAGAPTNVAALGLFKTVQVGGAFRGMVIVEISEDGNEWGQPIAFQTPGYTNRVVAAEFMRVRRVGVPLVDPGQPIVNIAATDDFSGDDGVAISAGTQSVATGTVVFADSNGVSFGMSASSQVTASHDGFRSISAGTTNALGPGLSLANGSGVSFGINGSTLTASMNPGAISAGASSFTLGTAVFASGSGISFGASAGTVTASVIQSDIAAIKSISAGTTNAQGPGLSFADSNNVTFGINGSTLTASVLNASFGFFAPSEFSPMLGGGVNQSSLLLHPVQFPNLAFGQYGGRVSFSADAGSVGTMSISSMIGIYSRNVSTLSLMHSSSISVSLGYSNGASSASLNGIRDWTLGWTSTISQGDYWVGAIVANATAGQNASLSLVYVSNNINANFSGQLGVASNASNQLLLGMGFFSAATAAMPASVAFSDIRGTLAGAARPLYFQFGASTV